MNYDEEIQRDASHVASYAQKLAGAPVLRRGADQIEQPENPTDQGTRQLTRERSTVARMVIPGLALTVQIDKLSLRDERGGLMTPRSTR
jgi:hypothetical protein